MKNPRTRTVLLLIPCLMLAACAGSGRAGSDATRVHYDRGDDVTRYSTPLIRLTQVVHLARFPVNLTISGGCEGQDSHCRPDDVLWEFDASPEFSQLLGSDRIDFVVDDDYQTFEMNVYQGRVEERWATSRFRFRIPFEFTERVANADDVVIKMGGNDIRLDDRRKEIIRDFVDLVQHDGRS